MCLFTIFISVYSHFAYGDDSLYRCPRNLPKDTYLRTHRDMCYRFITHETSWLSAKDYCSRTGGALITIVRRDIQLFVEGVLRELWRNNGMWIGAHDRDSEMDWKWITGQRVSSTYSNWDSGQPSCFLPDFFCHEDCAVLRVDEGYKWHDYLCGSDLYKYGYVCQYDMLPPTTTPQRTLPASPLVQTEPSSTTTTSTTTTTTTATTTTTTTTSTVPVAETETTKLDVKTSQGKQQTTAGLESLSNLDKEPDSASLPPVDVMNAESHRQAEEESGMKTGGLVGLVVTFLLVFIAGVIAGIFICRRRKRFADESLLLGFNNIVYTAAPVNNTRSKVKDTNLQATCVTDDSDEEEKDHRYVDIDELEAHCAKLPHCKGDYEPMRVSCPKENVYDTVQGEQGESDQEVGGADEGALPPPCSGVKVKQFAPEFLKKDTDVSKAYSNNLYG